MSLSPKAVEGAYAKNTTSQVLGQKGKHRLDDVRAKSGYGKRSVTWLRKFDNAHSRTSVLRASRQFVADMTRHLPRLMRQIGVLKRNLSERSVQLSQKDIVSAGHSDTQTASSQSKTNKEAENPLRKEYPNIKTENNPPLWRKEIIPAGSKVYHGTTGLHIGSILENGIAKAGTIKQNYGGGVLGAGFYTTSNQDTAAVYGSATGEATYVIEMETTKDLTMRRTHNATSLERAVDGEPLPFEHYVDESDGFVHEGDDNYQNAEIKFHDGGKTLDIKKILSMRPDGDKWVCSDSFTPQEYLNLIYTGDRDDSDW